MPRLKVSDTERTLVEKARLVERLRERRTKVANDLAALDASLEAAQKDLMAAIAGNQSGAVVPATTPSDVEAVMV